MFFHLHDSCLLFLLQALPYVALLIVMMFFIYAVIGMQVRCKVRKVAQIFIVLSLFLLSVFFFSSPSAKQRRNPCSGPSPVYQDLITRYDWPVKNAIVDLPIRLKENS